MDSETAILATLKCAMDVMPVAAAMTDKALAVRYANAGFKQLINAETDLCNSRLTDWLPRQSDRLRIEHGAKAATAKTPEIVHEILVGTSPATSRLMSVIQHVIFTEDDAIAGYLFRVPATHPSNSPSGNLRELLSGLTHDFNNVLTVITANLANALSYNDDAIVRTHVERSAAAARFATDLTRAAHELTLDTSPPLQTIDVGQVIDRFATFPGSFEGPRVSISHAPETSPLIVLAQSTAIERILRNLVQNAREAGARNVRMETRVEALGDHFAKAIVSVADDGTGIPPSIRARVFLPFVSLKGGARHLAAFDAERPPSIAHMGFGLAIVKNLMTQMKGEVTLTTPSEGFNTCFELSWPLLGGAVQSSAETLAVKR